ncbi:MAG: response regulator [Anaerolineae bacterium]|nr:response regulator [Anaerolineae bacterium]
MVAEVLLVEDSPTQADQIKMVLEEAGDLNVRVVYNALDGLREAQENPPDLIVLDVVLPDMDGFQVCRRLKRDPATQNIPIIMLTEKASASATVSGLNAGADDYIPKDIFASEHLVDTLTELGILE